MVVIYILCLEAQTLAKFSFKVFFDTLYYSPGVYDLLLLPAALLLFI